MTDLFSYQPEPREPPPADPIERAFREFHCDNPKVYHELVRLARRLHIRGRKHYGIKALFEVVRYDLALETTDAEFKLNNNFTALYARLIMREIPDLAGFFETRVRNAERGNKGESE